MCATGLFGRPFSCRAESPREGAESAGGDCARQGRSVCWTSLQWQPVLTTHWQCQGGSRELAQTICTEELCARLDMACAPGGPCNGICVDSRSELALLDFPVGFGRGPSGE